MFQVWCFQFGVFSSVIYTGVWLYSWKTADLGHIWKKGGGCISELVIVNFWCYYYNISLGCWLWCVGHVWKKVVVFQNWWLWIFGVIIRILVLDVDCGLWVIYIWKGGCCRIPKLVIANFQCYYYNISIGCWLWCVGHIYMKRRLLYFKTGDCEFLVLLLQY